MLAGSLNETVIAAAISGAITGVATILAAIVTARSHASHQTLPTAVPAPAPPGGKGRRIRRPGDFRRRILSGPARVLELISELPTLRRETKPWLATILGFFTGGIGIAIYFRTRVDVIIGTVLAIPLVVAGSLQPEDTSTASEQPPPWWIWIFLAISALYGFLRADTSNRHIEAAGVPVPSSPDERRDALLRRLWTLEAEGWQTGERGDFRAIVYRSGPNHILHLILTLFTFGLWGIVWLALSLRGGERRKLVAVDDWGTVRLRKIR